MDGNINERNFKVPNQLFFEIIQEELQLGKTVKFNVSGNSMLPFLRHSDQVIIKQPEDLKVKVGEIILAKYKGKIVLHRLVRIKANAYYLAGDGNLDQIEVIYEEDILAIVLLGYRGKKELKVNSWLNKKKGLIWYYIRPFRYIFRKVLG